MSEFLTSADELADLPVGSVVLDSGSKMYGGSERTAWTKSDDTRLVDGDGESEPYAWGSITWAKDRTDDDLVAEFGPLRVLWDPRTPHV